MEIISYKVELAAITVKFKEEFFTSKSDFFKLDLIPVYQPNTEIKPTFSGRRISGGLYKSTTGKIFSSDINGSYNIMRKAIPNAFASGVEGLVDCPISSNTEQTSGMTIFIYANSRKRWIDHDAGKVKADSDFLREKEKNVGLSVSIARTCLPQQCAKKFHQCFGVASINVARIRGIGLDVVPDSSNHANITGLPYREDDRDGYERFAALLARQSRVVWTPEFGFNLSIIS